MEYKIQMLNKEKWQSYNVVFSDFADSCYDVEISRTDNTFSVIMSKKLLEERKTIKYSQKLFEISNADVKVWGVIVDKQLVAGIETAIGNQNQNPRLYVSKLWVDEKYRRQGIAAALINQAKTRAIEENCRAVFLETWSCNEHAIDFYLSQGFTLIGFDSSPFSNEDIKKYQVPLKLGYYL